MQMHAAEPSLSSPKRGLVHFDCQSRIVGDVVANGFSMKKNDLENECNALT